MRAAPPNPRAGRRRISIVRYDLSGAPLGVFSPPGNGVNLPFFAVVTATPEPSAVLLLGTGAALLLPLARRRRA